MAGPYNTGSATNYLGIGKQSLLGTAVAPTVWVPYTGDVAIDHGLEGEDIREGGSGPYLARSIKTKHGPGGGFATPWRPSTAAKLVAWFLGSDQVAAAGSLFAHTATPAEAAVLLSIETNQSDEIIERIADSVLSKLTITGPEANAELMAAFEYAGTTPAWQGAATAESYETGIHGSTPGAPFRSGDAAFTIGGVVVTNVVSWELGLDWGIDTDIYTSKVTRNRIIKLILTGELTVRTLELDTVDYRGVNYNGGSAAAVDFPTLTGGNAFIAAYSNGLTTTNLRDATITVPQLQWKGAPRRLQAAGTVSVLERKAQLIKSASPLISIVSTNADTSAY